MTVAWSTDVFKSGVSRDLYIEQTLIPRQVSKDKTN